MCPEGYSSPSVIHFTTYSTSLMMFCVFNVVAKVRITTASRFCRECMKWLGMGYATTWRLVWDLHNQGPKAQEIVLIPYRPTEQRGGTDLYHVSLGCTKHIVIGRFICSPPRR